MNSLARGYSMQSVTMADTSRLTRLANEYAHRWSGRDAITEEHLRVMLSSPGFDLATSARLILDPDGALVAAGLVFHRDPHVTVHAWGLVGEAHQRLGIGRCLHDWILERSQTTLGMAPAGARVVIHQNTFDGDEAAEAFLQDAGYTQTRHYWRMLIEFDASPRAPEWPGDLALVEFDPERDLEASVHASWDAFQDHYGFVAGSIEDEFERTRHRIEADPDYDPSLWFLAKDGDEIAGLCFCSPKEAGDDTTGYVQALGVRPAWRRRGLGRAFLLHSFGEFHRRGRAKVALHVDGQSLTGATRLYESAGMHVDELSHEYELELRPGIELAVKGSAD